MRYFLPFSFAASLLAMSFPALAQYPAGNQTGSNQVGEVDTRVGRELYGNTINFTLRPYQVRLLPSEERNAIVRSGMLPSELSLNRASVGPLSPNGILDYVTPRSPLQQAMKLPTPQLYNPMYEMTLNPYAKANQDQMAGVSGVEGNEADKNRENRAGAQSPLSAIPTQPLPNGELSNGILPDGRISNRPESLPPVHTVQRNPNVRHGTIQLKRPSTQPTPPPQPQGKP